LNHMKGTLHFMTLQIMIYPLQAVAPRKVELCLKVNHQAVLVFLALPKNITILLQWTPNEFCLFPEVRCEEAVGIANSHKGSFECVF